jgi:acyl-CoA synthetase (AMP-forming)/AMP-acid ligase II
VSTLAEIEARLLAPGAPFETAVENVLGAPVQVFRQRRRSLGELLLASAAHGEKEYLVYEGRRVTYAEHLRLVASVAASFRERFGVGPGDRVAILAANCPAWIVSFWAATSLGAIAVGLNGWWARNEILYGLGDCEPRLLVGDARRLARIEGAKLGCPVVRVEEDFDALERYAAQAPLPAAPTGEDDPAAILYTSGTTGRPKGAVNTHRGILALVQLQLFHGTRLFLAQLEALRGAPPAAAQPPQQTVLVNAPLFHVSGLYTGVVTSLATGIRTVWMAGRFDARRVMETIEKERVTSWGPMGTMAHRVVHHPDVGRYDLSSVRTLGSGGAPVAPELQARLREVFPNARASFGLGYGSTECTALATLNFGEELERHPRSVGRPLPTVEIEIRDDSGRALPEGAEGEIAVRSPLVMREYWRRPEATAEAIAPGRWLRTGDWGRMQDGRLTLDSRRRDLILRGAENVYPAEIELRLEAHPDVREAAVVGVDHPELGQEVKAVVVPEPGRRLDTSALARWVADALAYFKVPAHWELREEPLPRNATGKVLKHLLVAGGESPFLEE